MSKGNSVKEFLEEYAIVFISVVISVLDFFGLLDKIPWLGPNIPTFTFLLVGILLQYMIKLQSSMIDLRAFVQQDITEKISALRKHLDPNLDMIFGEHISDLLTNVEHAIKDRTFEFHDMDLFRYFYKRTLEVYPRTTFLATSLPYQRYFWKNQPMEQAIARFINSGGKMKRIFFIANEEELNNEEVKEILSAQVKLGVDTYIVDIRMVPAQLRRFFLVEAEGKIAWEVFIGPDHRIVRIEATSDPSKTEKFNMIFQDLLKLEGTRHYSG
jgi:hypothetical protein